MSITHSDYPRHWPCFPHHRGGLAFACTTIAVTSSRMVANSIGVPRLNSNLDQDRTEASLKLMAIRAELASLVAEWRAAGRSDPLPTFRERQANRKTAAARR